MSPVRTCGSVILISNNLRCLISTRASGAATATALLTGAARATARERRGRAPGLPPLGRARHFALARAMLPLLRAAPHARADAARGCRRVGPSFFPRIDPAESSSKTLRALFGQHGAVVWGSTAVCGCLFVVVECGDFQPGRRNPSKECRFVGSLPTGRGKGSPCRERKWMYWKHDVTSMVPPNIRYKHQLDWPSPCPWW